MAFYLILLSSLMGIGLLLKFILPDIFEKFFLILTFLVLSLVSAIRFGVGYDYLYIYVGAFNEVVRLSFDEIISSYFISEQIYYFVGRHEIGYVLLQYIVSLFTTDFRAIFVVTSIIVNGLVCILFYKYAEDKILAVFLYFCFGMFYSSLNFVRQNISAILIAFAFTQIKERNFKKFLILVVLAGLFHKGAFFMLPFYFILQLKMSKLVLSLYSSVMVVILLFSNVFITFAIDNFFPWYDLGVNSNLIENGIPLYYLIVPSFIFILLFRYKDLLVENRNYIYVNIAFFNMFFFVLGAKHFIIERFTLFFQYATIIGVSILIKRIKEDNYYNLVFTKTDFKSKLDSYLPYFLVVVVGLGLNLFLLNVDGHSVVPYRTIFGDLYERYILINS